MSKKAMRALESLGDDLKKSLGMGFGTFSQPGSTTVTAPVAAVPVPTGPASIETLAKAVGEMQAQIATIAEAIKPKTETSEAGELRKSVDSVVAEFEDVKKALDLTIDRISSGEAMRKSAGGDEVLAGQGTAAPAAGEPMTKAASGWDSMLKGMRNNPGKPVFLR